MRELMPWMGMTGLKREMDRLVDRFFEHPWTELPAALGEWTPNLDVAETKDAFVVKLEVPGMEPTELNVTLQDNVLTLKGEKKRETEEKDARYFKVERGYGTFTRTIRLPANVDTTGATAAFKNGLMTVTLPKAPGAKGTMIPVKPE